MMQKLELYIHIPFCVQKCAYCDFLSAPANDAAKAEYVDALKKENFQEYVTRTQNEIAGIESKIEAEELKKLQLEHKMKRLQNVTEYKVNKSRKARVSRLITRGAAIECICKDVELLDKAEFFLLAERIFSDQDLRDKIAKMVVGRRERAEAGEAELQSTIEDLKEAGYWKSSRKE